MNSHTLCDALLYALNESRYMYWMDSDICSGLIQIAVSAFLDSGQFALVSAEAHKEFDSALC